MEMLPMLEAEAKERQKAAGGDHGNQYTRGKQAVIPALGEVAIPKPTSTHLAAAAIGVSHGNISEMKRVTKVAPERVEEIKQGKITVHTF